MEKITFTTQWRGGRGAATRARELTEAFAESAHTFALATEEQAGGAQAPGQISGHLGRLSGGFGYSSEALDRMAERLAAMDERGELRHAADGHPSDLARAAIVVLRDAAAGTRDLIERIQAARHVLADLGMTEAAEQAFEHAYSDPRRIETEEDH